MILGYCSHQFHTRGFSIAITVKFIDGSTNKTSYFLKLLGGWPQKAAPEVFDSTDSKNVYEALIHEKYRWRKVSTVIKQTNLPESKVLGVLKKLEQENLVRKAYFQSVDNKDLWGATAVVGISPGTTEE